MPGNENEKRLYWKISQEELDETLSEHMEWLLTEEIHGRRAWLANANLEGKSLSWEYLKKAVFRKANLSGTNLIGVMLNHSDLERADLITANLEGGRLFQANLKGAYLIGANLGRADLSGANLERSDLRGANLEKDNFFNANLEGANLSGANLKGANLIQANLKGAHLLLANLEGAKLFGANLKGADLREVNLSEANVSSVQYDRKSKENIRYAGIRVATCYGNPLFKRNAEDLDWLNNYMNTREKWWQKLWLYFWKLTSDYGQNFWRWALVSICIAFFFASVFFILGPSCFKIPELPGRPPFCRFEFTLDSIWLFTQGFLTTLYFSTVTFTTLGFGDVIPKNLGAAMIVMLEVVIGYIMLGGLISIFANILARRS